jgi:hypothetical protein
MKAEGRAALGRQQARYGGEPDPEPEPDQGGAAPEPGEVALSRAQRVERLRALREALAGK